MPDDEDKKKDEKPEEDASEEQKKDDTPKEPIVDTGKGGMEKTDVKAVNEELLEDIKQDNKKTLDNVKIYSPFRVYYNGEADSISASNLTGPFDILPGHKNFMTLLTPGEVVVRSKRGAEKLKIERGVMHVRRNRVEVFLDV